VIAGQHADTNGSYVALTRARERTHLYASAERLDQPAEEGDGGEAQLTWLAEQLGRSEPEVPSIAVALAHEHQVEREHADHSAPPASWQGEREREQRDQARVLLDQARARLEQARARLEQARARLEQARVWLEQARVQRLEAAAVMANEPRDQRAEHARGQAEVAGELARLAAGHGERLQGERADLGRLARLGERGRALKTQLAVERARERAALAEQHRYSQEADVRELELYERRREWEARHPGARERHHAAQREHQLAEQAHQTAQQHYEIAEIANVRAVHAVSYPARLTPGRAEPGQLTPGVSQATRLWPRGPGHERSGPTIER